MIIPAAGIGKRFSKNIKKQFYEINGKPILYFTLKNMLQAYDFKELIIGINDEDIDLVNNIYNTLGSNVPLKLAKGGSIRSETVYNCLKVATSDISIIHDAVRPFVSYDIVRNVIKKTSLSRGAICAIPVRDTVKYVERMSVIKTLPRENIYLAHTPQGFYTNDLISAIEQCQDKQSLTDEASAMEFSGHEVAVVDSSADNIKITFTEDVDFIDRLVKEYCKE